MLLVLVALALIRRLGPQAPEPPDERGVRSGDDERLVSQLALAACEEIYLTLPAAPLAAGVEVQHSHWAGNCHR